MTNYTTNTITLAIDSNDMRVGVDMGTSIGVYRD